MYQSIQTAGSLTNPHALAIVLHEKAPLPTEYRPADTAVGGVLSAALARPDFKASAGSVTALHPSRGPRLFVLGLGPVDKFHANHLRAAASRLTPALHAAGVRSVVIDLGPLAAHADSAAAFGEGLGLGGFIFDQFKGAAANNGRSRNVGPRALTVATAIAAHRGAIDRGLTIAESANVARDLAATPPNVANPLYIADYCRKLARRTGLKCTVIDAARARQLKMGGLLAVGGAGSTPPALVTLEWKPRRTATRPQAAPVLVVGKAITFDTGGYSIKPTDGMLPMKYDKSAGMAVIGLMQAVATLELPVHVVGLIPAAENMIGHTAYRPSDILTMFNGVTVEVTNTDAEGRLVLADALAYGCKKYKPQMVIDMATLTGAIVVALGPWSAGLYCNDERLFTRLLTAAEASGERVWRMPLWPEHRKHIKATHGDIANSAGRDGSPCTAAAFLSHFVAKDGDFTKNEKIPWAHIDIAGVSDVGGDRDPTGIYPKGPTGYGVRLLVNLLENL